METRKTAFEKIVKDIKEQESLVEEQIKSEVEYSHEDQVKIFKAGLDKEIDTYFEKEINDLRLYTATEASQAKLQTKKSLLNKRSEMVDDLFDEVVNRLKDFVVTHDYKDYLTKKIKGLDMNDSSYFVIRKEDEALFKEILKELNLNINFKFEHFNIGGFLLVDEKNGFEYDLSLDSKLKEQKIWFQNNSGFTFER